MKSIYFAILLLVISSCQLDKKLDNSFFAQPEKVKISEQEIYFNQKQMNPLNKKIPSNIHLKEQEFVNRIASATTQINWHLRGPQNVGGRTRALALDVENTDRIIVGGVSGGIWISENLGESYTKATTTQQFQSVTCIAQDTRAGHTNIWYYGTGEQNGNSSDLLGNGIYKSIDNGLTWQLIESTSNDSSTIISSLGDFRYVKDIKVSPINGDILVASFSGIWRSDDGGAHWINELIGGSSPNGFGYVNFGKQTNIDVSKDGVFYATLSSDCTNRGIWRSADGDNWENITPSDFPTAYRRIESGIASADGSQVYFIADVSASIPLTDNHELWKLNYNLGLANFTDKTVNIPTGTCTGFYDFDFGYFQSQNSYDLYIAVHPSDTNLVYLGGTNLYRSTDGFSSPAYEWIGGYFCDPSDPGNYIFPNHHPDNHAAVFVPNSNIMISAHDGGLSKTNNCKANNIEWESINNGYNTTQFYTVAIESGASENDIIIGGMQDNGTWMTNSTNPNQVWMNTFYGDGAYCAISEGRENYYISWQGGKTFKAQIDDDGNVSTITRIDPSGASDYQFINPFILNPSDNGMMLLAAGRYMWVNDSLNEIPNVHDEFVSNDMGWQRIDESFISSFNSSRISSIAMSKSNADIVYYGTTGGSIYRLEGLNSSSYSKTDITKSNMPSSAYVSSIYVNQNDADKVLMSFSNYEVESIFYTEDAGANWVAVSGNLEQFENGSGAGPSVNWVHMHFDGTNNIYLAGTTSGLFSTQVLDSANTNWSREGLQSIGNVPVAMITSREYDDNIVVATHGNGIFSTKEFISGLETVNNETNGNYLSNIAPNPVRNKIKFSYRLGANALVDIKVYDATGQIVESIAKQNQEAGSYEKNYFFKNKLSNGIYFLVLNANDSKLTKQFIAVE